MYQFSTARRISVSHAHHAYSTNAPNVLTLSSIRIQVAVAKSLFTTWQTVVNTLPSGVPPTVPTRYSAYNVHWVHFLSIFTLVISALHCPVLYLTVRTAIEVRCALCAVLAIT